MQLSPHFKLEELIHTNTRYAEENSVLSPEQVEKLRVVCATLLEPIRDQFGPVVIHSGYRCSALNKAIGGSETSQHMLAEACDFHVAGHTLEEVFWWIVKESKIPYGQIILEGPTPSKPTWIHISLGEPYRAKKKSRQAMKFDGTKYTLV